METRVEIKATKAETRAETEAKENGNEAKKKWKSKRNKETNLEGTIRLTWSQNDELCNAEVLHSISQLDFTVRSVTTTLSNCKLGLISCESND